MFELAAIYDEHADQELRAQQREKAAHRNSFLGTRGMSTCRWLRRKLYLALRRTHIRQPVVCLS